MEENKDREETREENEIGGVEKACEGKTQNDNSVKKVLLLFCINNFRLAFFSKNMKIYLLELRGEVGKYERHV